MSIGEERRVGVFGGGAFDGFDDGDFDDGEWSNCSYYWSSSYCLMVE